MSKLNNLRFDGAGTLTFVEDRARRTVVAGEAFAVGDELAKVLLVDPAVTDLDHLPPDPDAPAPEDTGYADMTVPQLRELAAKRGLEVPTRAPKADLVAAHVAADDAAQAGEPASGPAVEPDTAQPDLAEAGTGPVTLGDLPESAKVRGA